MMLTFRKESWAVLFAVLLSASGVSSQGSDAGLSVTLADDLPKAWGTSYVGKIYSKALGDTRTVHVFLPHSYKSTHRKYPMIFSGDGGPYYQPLAIAAHELSDADHIPECIVVAVETPERRKDMTPLAMKDQPLGDGDPRAEKFMAFMANELRPAIAAKFRGTTPAVLIGHSQGGILCHYAAANWRQQFPFIVSLDAPVHLDREWLAKNLESTVSKGGVLRLISLEVVFGWRQAEWDSFSQSAPKNWQLYRAKLGAESHESMYFTGFYEGLKRVFADYSAWQMKKKSAKEIFAHYEGLAKDYGETPIPPEGTLRDAVMELSYTGNGAAAHRALNLLALGFGEPKDRAQQERDIDEAEAHMKGQLSVAELVALPHPTPEQMRPYLGTWKGRFGMDGEEGSEHTVKFFIKGGRVVATDYSERGPGEWVTESVPYLRVTSGGIEFGGLNGMHPRGVNANVAKLVNGKLVGEMIFKGVYFKFSFGTPPKLTFSYSKVSD